MLFYPHLEQILTDSSSANSDTKAMHTWSYSKQLFKFFCLHNYDFPHAVLRRLFSFSFFCISNETPSESSTNKVFNATWKVFFFLRIHFKVVLFYKQIITYDVVSYSITYFNILNNCKNDSDLPSLPHWEIK